jgi:hypothetical protein
MKSPQLRRWFRFSLLTMLIVTTVIAVVLGWWVTWPQRAKTRFIKLYETAPDEAHTLTTKSGGALARELSTNEHDPLYLEPHIRSLSDILRAKQTFAVVAPVRGQDTEFTSILHVERGSFRGPMLSDTRPKRPGRE